MKKIIHFYFKQIIPLLSIIFGVYLLFNILTLTFGAFLHTEIYRSIIFVCFIMFIFLAIYLIQFNQLDTGKENFSIVSMTDQSHTSIMLSKLIVSYIVIITFIVFQSIFMMVVFSSIPHEYGTIDFISFFFYGALRILAIFTILISYIANPMIWVKSFSSSKTFRRLSFIGIIITWFITNRVIQRTFLGASTMHSRMSGRFEDQQSLPIMLFWNLAWCIVFFAITLKKKKRKIDSL